MAVFGWQDVLVVIYLGKNRSFLILCFLLLLCVAPLFFMNSNEPLGCIDKFDPVEVCFFISPFYLCSNESELMSLPFSALPLACESDHVSNHSPAVI
jgi:hypothetical protein